VTKVPISPNTKQDCPECGEARTRKSLYVCKDCYGLTCFKCVRVHSHVGRIACFVQLTEAGTLKGMSRLIREKQEKDTHENRDNSQPA